MDLDFIVDKFLNISELPGIKAHEEVSPMNRPLSYDQIDISEYRTSSVMFFIYEKEGKPYTVAIERNTYDGVHSGQIGLPGGKSEEQDQSFFDTAARESNEEIGIDLSKIRYLKELSQVFIPVSRFIVNPFIAFLEEKNPVFKADIREVSKVIEIPVEQILKDSNLKTKNMSTGNGLVIKDVPYFHLEGQVVWGATALIFNEVKHILTS